VKDLLSKSDAEIAEKYGQSALASFELLMK
jgi:hypothetical protein